ncbi:hypothetical protein PsYK624_077090 [Phanerochaete sordida]|uniref:Uncharacterized protein n=1 Tax=Phanerochaete sordida TaxID=48140 RepID=A0A9P3GBY7_9APHY|nr:hypothetical protein PsYK624_077090 [Phanerochaete sordida]
MHIALLFVYFCRYEQIISFPLTPFSVEWYPLAVTTLMQVFGTILLAVLVLYTQALAFRSDLYVRQTLTALHDKSSAWLGLGAACGSLWDQLKLRAAMVGVVYITAYLFGVWLLHITIPTSLNVVPYNATVSTIFRTVLGNTSMNADYASAYDILLVYDQVPTLGLQGNMVYDVIPPVPSASGSTTVNGSVYDVDCAALPFADTTIEAWQTMERSGQPNMTWLAFNLDNSSSNTTYFAALSIPDNAAAVFTGNVFDTETECNSPASYSYIPGNCWVPIVLLSTVDILDSTDSQAPIPGGAWRPMDPQVIVPPPIADPASMITAVQLLACNVNIMHSKVDVSIDTRTPALTVQKLLPKTVWKNWTRPADMTLTDQLRVAQNAPFFSPPSGHSSYRSIIVGSANVSIAAPPVALPGFELEAFQVEPIDENHVPNAIMKSSSTKIGYPSAFDVWLNEDLRIAADNRTNVTLAEIEHSLARALAATFWYGGKVNYSSSHAIRGLLMPESPATLITNITLNLTATNTSVAEEYGEAIIMVPVQRLRLNLSLVPIVIGLVASLALLILCMLVIHVPANARAAFDPKIVVDSGGLLQYTWLLGNEPHLAHVDSPELDNLRAAGMFDVSMGDHVKLRLSSRASTFVEASGYDEYELDSAESPLMVKE